MMMKQNGCERLLTEAVDSFGIQMDWNIKENGSKLVVVDRLEHAINMEKEFTNIKMVQDILDNGSKTLDVVKGNRFVVMDLSILVNGLMIRNTVMDTMLIKMVTNIWATLLMI